MYDKKEDVIGLGKGIIIPESFSVTLIYEDVLALDQTKYPYR